MRIFYDHQVFSLQDAGGASRYHYELIRNLPPDEGAVELLIGANRSVMPFAHLRHPRTKVWSLRSSIPPGAGRYVINELFSAFISPFCGKFDIYHPTLYRAIPWVRRRRMVVTHHDCTHERFPQLFANAATIVEAKRKLFAQADAIVCVSHSSRDDLLHFYDIAAEKTHVVPHGFSPLILSPENSQKVSVVPYLLYVGSRAGYKNFDLCLQAFSLSGLASSHQLLAVGGGPWTANEQQRIAALNLSRSVVLIPKAEEGVLARAYQAADLFVYPSLYEGFGFPPLEAMSMGCPVLVNRTSSLPEVCGDAAFYFEATGPEELAQSLLATLSNSVALAEKRKLGEERVKLYSWRQSALSTLEVYRHVLNGF